MLLYLFDLAKRAIGWESEIVEAREKIKAIVAEQAEEALAKEVEGLFDLERAVREKCRKELRKQDWEPEKVERLVNVVRGLSEQARDGVKILVAETAPPEIRQLAAPKDVDVLATVIKGLLGPGEDDADKS